MADELKFPYPSGSGTAYCRVLNPAGQAFRSDSHVFESINPSNASHYAAASLSDTGLNTYVGSFPAAIATAAVIQYGVEMCIQAGSSPAASDAVVGGGVLYWNGTVEVFPATVGAQMDLVNSPNATGIGAIAAGVWAALSGAMTTAGSIGLKLASWIAGQPGAGSGPIAIDQNTGGTDNLRYVDQNGNGIEGADVLIYLASDWPANPGQVQAAATTGPDGRWLSPAFVASGTYVAVFTKLGADGPDVSPPFTV